MESRREGAREQDTEGERVSSSEVELSQLVTQVSQAGRQRGSVSGSKQVVLPLQGLITRGGAGGRGGLCTSLLQSLWLTTRSLSHQLILGKTDRIVHWVSPLDTKSKCLWLAAVKKEGSEQDGVG